MRDLWRLFTTAQNSPISRESNELLTIAERAQVHTFAWPIGVVLRNRDNARAETY